MKDSKKVILVDAVHTLVVEDEKGFSVFDEMHTLLETFPNRKIVLTGANDEQYRVFGLQNVPYEVFTLKHNPEKTDPEYYQKLLQSFDLKLEQVVYFEHDRQAVQSAESVGIVSYWYDSEKKDLKSLANFLEQHL